MNRIALALALFASSCGKNDNSADTDRSGSALTKAQSELTAKRDEVTTRESEIEREKRELLQKQQALADEEKALIANREQLGSARESLAQARTAYKADITARLAKLDSSLATLSTRTDAASKDAVIGLRARREQLAITIATMTTTIDENWAAYTKNVDTTFDAIERDLGAAAN